MRDIYSNLSVTQILSAAAAKTTQTSSPVDLQGFNGAMIVFNMGLSGDTLSGSVYWTLKIQDSPDGVTYTDVAVGLLSGNQSSNTIVLNAPGQDQKAYKFGYIGNNRYLQAVATPTGTTTNGIPIGIISTRGKPSLAPTS